MRVFTMMYNVCITMRKNWIIILCIVVVGGIGTYALMRVRQKMTPHVPHSISTPASADTTIIFPQKNDRLTIGKTYTLQWAGNGEGMTDIFLIDVALKPVGASVSSVDRLYHVPNTGSYAYTVPQRIDPGTYQFEIGTTTGEEFQIGK